MKVFFTASKRNKATHQNNYDSIIHLLQKRNIEVISLEIGKYTDLLPKTYIKKHNCEEIHYEYTSRAIANSHAVIIEASSNSFQLGHESTLALLYSKPILCLSDGNDYSIKIKHPLFKAAKYSALPQIEIIIDKFLKKYENKFLTVRFNTFISPEQKHFMDWYKNSKGICASELVRELLVREMKNTKNYRK